MALILDGDGSISGVTTIGTLDQLNVTGLSTFSAGLNVTSGDVGIGTDNPTSDGGRTLQIQANTTPSLKFDQSNAFQAYLQLRGNDLEIRGSSGQMEFYTGNDNGASSTERLRITDAGDVGIGTINPTGTAALTNNTATLAVGVATVGSLHVNGNPYPSAGPLSNRNLIINGAMQVAQRGTEVTSVTSTGYRAVDRYEIGATNAGTWTVSQDSDAPEGFSKSLKMDCTTQNGSLLGTALLYVAQKIEAQNLQHLSFGSANAQELTFSLYFKSNKTGLYNVEMFQADASRSISFDMNVTQTGWQRYQFVVPGDTAGTINDDNGIGWWCIVWLGAGPDFSSGTRNTTWDVSTQADRLNSAQVNLADNVGNECFLTGFQLELGSVATPFEHRSFGDELAKCQRYFQSLEPELDMPMVRDTSSDSLRRGTVQHKVTMRVAPTASNLTVTNNSATSIQGTTVDSTRVQATSSTTGSVCRITAIDLSSEL